MPIALATFLAWTVAAGCGGKHVATVDGGETDAAVDSAWPDGGHTDCPGPQLCPRDPFVSPLPLSGPAGWQSSTGEVCFARAGQLATGAVRADARGVFALVGTSLDLENNFTASTGWQLMKNDGSAWTTVQQQALPNGISSGVNQLEIAPNGTLAIVNPSAATGTSSCGIILIDTLGATTCLLPNAAVTRVAFAPDGRLFALDDSGVNVYSGGSWGPLFAPPQGSGLLTDLWTDGTTTFVVGYTQTIIRHVTGGTAELLASPPVGNYTRITGSSATNVFVGTQTGQIVHLGAGGFSLMETGLPVCGFGGPISGLWLASNGDLYASALRGIVKVPSGGAPQVLAQWPCDIDVSVMDVYGSNARGERYFSLRNAAETYRTCGETHLVVQDSSGFRLF